MNGVKKPPGIVVPLCDSQALHWRIEEGGAPVPACVGGAAGSGLGRVREMSGNEVTTRNGLQGRNLDGGRPRYWRHWGTAAADGVAGH